jgi:RNA 3'-terminal phosphate cyclase (ATP)
MLDIDGSYGEGGGQILRSALALSLRTGRAFRLRNIRAGRGRPGLLRQHLTCVRAAEAVGQGQVTGGELGSTELVFEPGALRAGEHTFAVGSAGSAMLVLQTVLLPLLRAPGASVLRLAGGTHNPAAPPFDFIDEVFLAALRGLGAEVTATLERHGFYPAGGGAVTVHITGGAVLAPFLRTDAPASSRVSAEVLHANLAQGVTHRETEALATALGLQRRDIVVRHVASSGPGNAVLLRVYDEREQLLELITTFGERGVSADAVVAEALSQLDAFRRSGAPVGEHLADQLLLPLALGSGGSFVASVASMHLATNAWLINQFLGPRVSIDGCHVSVVGQEVS